MEKKKKRKLGPEFWKRDAEHRRLLAERVAILEQRIREREEREKSA